MYIRHNRAPHRSLWNPRLSLLNFRKNMIYVDLKGGSKLLTTSIRYNGKFFCHEFVKPTLVQDSIETTFGIRRSKAIDCFALNYDFTSQIIVSALIGISSQKENKPKTGSLALQVCKVLCISYIRKLQLVTNMNLARILTLG